MDRHKYEDPKEKKRAIHLQSSSSGRSSKACRRRHPLPRLQDPLPLLQALEAPVQAVAGGELVGIGVRVSLAEPTWVVQQETWNERAV